MEPVSDLVVFPSSDSEPARRFPISAETIQHLYQEKIKEHFLSGVDGWICRTCRHRAEWDAQSFLLKHAATHEKEAENEDHSNN